MEHDDELSRSKARIVELEKQNQQLVADLKRARTSLSKAMPLTFDWVRGLDNMHMRFYTGLSCRASLDLFYGVLEACAADAYFRSPSGPPSALSWRDQVLLLLVYDRRFFPQHHLALLFHIAQSTVSRLYNRALSFVLHALNATVGRELHRADIDAHRLPMFTDEFSDVFWLADCTTVRVPRSRDPRKDAALFTAYKHTHACKLLVVTGADGKLAWVSRPVGAHASDVDVLLSCGFLDLVHVDEATMVDKGFENARDAMEAAGKPLVAPPFLRGGRFTMGEATLTKLVARTRAINERSVGLLKNFRIVDGPVPRPLWRRFHEIVNVCALLTHFNCPLSADVPAPSRRLPADGIDTDAHDAAAGAAESSDDDADDDALADSDSESASLGSQSGDFLVEQEWMLGSDEEASEDEAESADADDDAFHM